MEVKRCFEPGCTQEVECSCQCTSPETLSCELHVGKHIKLPGKTHTFNSIFVEPCQGTRESILSFLTKEISKHSKIKSKILNSFSKQILNSENYLTKLVKNLDSSSDELSNYYAKISQAKKTLKSEHDPILGLLALQPEEAIKKIKSIVPNNPDWYDSSKVFFGFSEKIEKMIECFIKDKFENYLDKRLTKIESTLEEHDKNISLANIELSNVKVSISKVIKKNNKSRKKLEDFKEETLLKFENETSLLNLQVASILEDLDLQKKAEKQNNITLQSLRDKNSEILNRPIDSELEKEFRRNKLLYESNQSMYDPQVVQAYHDYANNYYQKTSVYNLIKKDNRTNLVVYDTENERKEIKILQTAQPLSYSTCICQLQDGKLFCYGAYPVSGITLVIDKNCGIQELPSGTPCTVSSAIYLKRNVYCFGGIGINSKDINLSRRFDLDLNQWIELAPMPKAASRGNNIIFNENILIAWWKYSNLLRYSIKNNLFETIPFEFEPEKRKFLINAERLYLIECLNGSIYESEIGSDTAWRRIADSSIAMNALQVYCSYNKEGMYIGCVDDQNNFEHFKFDLNSKRISLLT